MEKIISFTTKTIVMLSMVFMVAACSLVDKVQDTSSEKIADLIVQYCAETNEYFRNQLREKINSKMAGQATVKVECLPPANEVSYGADIRINRDRGRYGQYGDSIFSLQSTHSHQQVRNVRLWRPQKVTVRLTA